MENDSIVDSFHHQYLWSMFPGYDYRSPTEAWKIHCRDNDGIRNCAWQMKAFHYWWIMKLCRKTGEVGLSINIDSLPFCVRIDNRHQSGHIFCAPPSAHKQFHSEKFPLVVASAFVPYFPCDNGTSRCEGVEVAKGIDNLARIVKPNGVVIAAVMDETGPRSEGRSLKESGNFVHTWTTKQYEKSVLNNLSRDIFEIEEFDTFKNDLSFNMVLRKK